MIYLHLNEIWESTQFFIQKKKKKTTAILSWQCDTTNAFYVLLSGVSLSNGASFS